MDDGAVGGSVGHPNLRKVVKELHFLGWERTTIRDFSKMVTFW
jgi:hypothetical protein